MLYRLLICVASLKRYRQKFWAFPAGYQTIHSSFEPSPKASGVTIIMAHVVDGSKESYKPLYGLSTWLTMVHTIFPTMK